MLSEEQKKLVEDNVNLIFYYLHKKHISLDVCDIGYIALCKAAKAYDPSKGYKFATFAMRAIINDYADGLRNKTRFNAESTMRSLDEPIYQDSTNTIYLYETLKSDFSMEKEIFMKEFHSNIKEFINSLPYNHKVIFNDFLEDKTQNDTAATLNCSQAQVSRIRKNLFKEFRDKYYKGIHIKDIEEML